MQMVCKICDAHSPYRSPEMSRFQNSKKVEKTCISCALRALLPADVQTMDSGAIYEQLLSWTPDQFSDSLIQALVDAHEVHKEAKQHLLNQLQSAGHFTQEESIHADEPLHNRQTLDETPPAKKQRLCEDVEDLRIIMPPPSPLTPRPSMSPKVTGMTSPVQTSASTDMSYNSGEASPARNSSRSPKTKVRLIYDMSIPDTPLENHEDICVELFPEMPLVVAETQLMDTQDPHLIKSPRKRQQLPHQQSRWMASTTIAATIGAATAATVVKSTIATAAAAAAAVGTAVAAAASAAAHRITEGHPTDELLHGPAKANDEDLPAIYQAGAQPLSLYSELGSLSEGPSLTPALNDYPPLLEVAVEEATPQPADDPVNNEPVTVLPMELHEENVFDAVPRQQQQEHHTTEEVAAPSPPIPPPVPSSTPADPATQWFETPAAIPSPRNFQSTPSASLSLTPPLIHGAVPVKCLPSDAPSTEEQEEQKDVDGQPTLPQEVCGADAEMLEDLPPVPLQEYADIAVTDDVAQASDITAVDCKTPSAVPAPVSDSNEAFEHSEFSIFSQDLLADIASHTSSMDVLKQVPASEPKSPHSPAGDMVEIPVPNVPSTSDAEGGRPVPEVPSATISAPMDTGQTLVQSPPRDAHYPPSSSTSPSAAIQDQPPQLAVIGHEHALPSEIRRSAPGRLSFGSSNDSRLKAQTSMTGLRGPQAAASPKPPAAHFPTAVEDEIQDFDSHPPPSVYIKSMSAPPDTSSNNLQPLGIEGPSAIPNFYGNTRAMPSSSWHSPAHAQVASLLSSSPSPRTPPGIQPVSHGNPLISPFRMPQSPGVPTSPFRNMPPPPPTSPGQMYSSERPHPPMSPHAVPTAIPPSPHVPSSSRSPTSPLPSITSASAAAECLSTLGFPAPGLGPFPYINREHPILLQSTLRLSSAEPVLQVKWAPRNEALLGICTPHSVLLYCRVESEWQTFGQFVVDTSQGEELYGFCFDSRGQVVCVSGALSKSRFHQGNHHGSNILGIGLMVFKLDQSHGGNGMGYTPIASQELIHEGHIRALLCDTDNVIFTAGDDGFLVKTSFWPTWRVKDSIKLQSVQHDYAAAGQNANCPIIDLALPETHFATILLGLCHISQVSHIAIWNRSTLQLLRTLPCPGACRLLSVIPEQVYRQQTPNDYSHILVLTLTAEAGQQVCVLHTIGNLGMQRTYVYQFPEKDLGARICMDVSYHLKAKSSKYLALGTSTGKVVLHNLSTGNCVGILCDLQATTVDVVTFHPQQSLFAAFSKSGLINVYWQPPPGTTLPPAP